MTSSIMVNSSEKPLVVVVQQDRAARSRLADLHGEHGNRSAVDAFDRKADAIALLAASKHVKQREVMVGRRNRQQCIFAQRFIVDEWLEVACEHEVSRGAFETHGPV